MRGRLSINQSARTVPAVLRQGRSEVLRLKGVFMIHQLREQGLTVSEIARRMRVDRKTVRRYLQHGVEQPRYGPRAPRPQKLDPYRAYLRGRLAKCPQLSAMRLLREIRDLGYQGGRTAVTDFVAAVRPREATGFEHRFETAAGEQAQVDFAQFKVVFAEQPEQPEQVQVVWLFSMVLGHCRYLFGRFVMRANLEAVVGCHVAAFAEFAGVPREVLYDRMKTVVLGEDDEGEIRYHPTLLDVAAHYGFGPRVCAAYRAKTKGKVERPFRYVREDFFLASQFENLRHLNAEFDHRLAAELRLYDRGALVAVHPVLEGQGQRRVADGHHTWPPPGSARREPEALSDLIPVGIPGEHLAERSLEVYEQLGRALAGASIAAGEHPEMRS